MRETLAPGGFNILHNIGRAAWQSIFHFHVHVIPRYEDDPLQLPWMPEPADPGGARSGGRRDARLRWRRW